MDPKYNRLKYACYTSNITMSVVGNLSPVLFLTFREFYGISYSLLGSLVLINFFTQLIVDLIFSFFSHKFNIPRVVKTMPYLAVVGLLIYAIWPFVFPHTVFLGLAIGTVIFSAAAGLGEVLISPVIAAIPSENPDHEMSKLHSIYAWGVVAVIIISTLFLLVFGAANWQWLALLFVLCPLSSAILFSTVEIPQMETPEKVSGVVPFLKNSGFWLSVGAIFLGGSSEVTMAQWCSGYLEQALGIPKVWGDLFGVALFSVMLGIGRSLYAKIGKKISKVLFWCAVGSTLCYLIAALSNIAVVGLMACALTGLTTSMLWPGNLIVAERRFPHGGVFLFAMMAAVGDLGASIGPQLVGIITDAAIENPALVSLADSLSLAPEQLGMKLGMLVGMLFPLAAIPLFAAMRKYRKE
ncbi:MAG: MFS transporter [Clostridia bacterium]|nr:MFS transporter [Clostridia bacterium]